MKSLRKFVQLGAVPAIDDNGFKLFDRLIDKICSACVYLSPHH